MPAALPTGRSVRWSELHRLVRARQNGADPSRCPNHLFLFEVYDNEAAFKTHRASEHFKKYAAVTANMVAKRVTRPMGAIGTNSKPR